LAAHEIPYAATATAGFLPDLARKVEKAKALRLEIDAGWARLLRKTQAEPAGAGS
jgi:hypothetical protein